MGQAQVLIKRRDAAIDKIPRGRFLKGNSRGFHNLGVRVVLKKLITLVINFKS